MKKIAIAITIIVVLIQLYMGFPTGKITLNVKSIDSANTASSNYEADSVNIFYIDATLDSGEKIQIQSTDRILLSFTGGHLYDVETYYSPLRL
jgi:hypothetical protein